MFEECDILSTAGSPLKPRGDDEQKAYFLELSYNMNCNFKFTEAMQDRAESVLKVYPDKRSALLPILWLVHDQEGCVPKASAEVVANMLDITRGEVLEAVSFYDLFDDKQRGLYHIKICVGPCCGLKNSRWLLSYLEDLLGIKVGETTMDNRFGLSTVQCLGYCGDSPVMQINDIFYDNLTPDMLDEIIRMLNR